MPGLQSREFVSRIVWKWKSSTKLVVVSEAADDPNFPPDPKYVRGTRTQLWVYDKLPLSHDTPQTRVTFRQQEKYGGFAAIPKFYADNAILAKLISISTLRKFLDKSPSIDFSQQSATAKLIDRHDEKDGWGVRLFDEYTADDDAIIQEGLAYINNFDKIQKKKRLKQPNPSIETDFAYSNNAKVGWGRTQVDVRASPQQVRALLSSHFVLATANIPVGPRVHVGVRGEVSLGGRRQGPRAR